MSAPTNIVPLRRHRAPKAPVRNRLIILAVRAGDLKQAVKAAYHDSLIDARDVADVFAEYGLRDD